jgi:hypothetical protein
MQVNIFAHTCGVLSRLVLGPRSRTGSLLGYGSNLCVCNVLLIQD